MRDIDAIQEIKAILSYEMFKEQYEEMFETMEEDLPTFEHWRAVYLNEKNSHVKGLKLNWDKVPHK